MNRLRERVVTARLALVALVLTTSISVACDDSSRPPRLTGSPWRAPLNLAEMAESADAIVLATITEEIESSWVPAPAPGGANSLLDPYRVRNFVFEVEESYIPGVESGETIVVRVADGQKNLRIADERMEVSEEADLAIGAELLLFLERMDRLEQQRTGMAAPPGHPAGSYYQLPSPDGDQDGTITTGYLVAQGDRWTYPGTESSAGRESVMEAVADHAPVVRTDCFGFEAPATDYVPIAPLGSLTERSDAVFKGRIGGSGTEVNADTLTFEVLDVVFGPLSETSLTFNRANWSYTPSFEQCDYYVFLRDAGGAFADELGPFYDLAAGPQSIFVADAGVVQQTRYWPLDDGYRGMSEGEFRQAVVRAAERAD